MDKCPGADLRFVTAEDVECPACGAMVELFSDEQKRRCHACGARVTRVAAPGCATWCPSARACLGSERYKQLEAAGVFDPPAEDDESSSRDG